MTGAGRIANYDDYINNHSTAPNFIFAGKNPGTWANQLKVCTIDDFADQTIGINTVNLANAGAVIGYGITQRLSNVTIPGAG